MKKVDLRPFYDADSLDFDGQSTEDKLSQIKEAIFFFSLSLHSGIHNEKWVDTSTQEKSQSTPSLKMYKKAGTFDSESSPNDHASSGSLRSSPPEEGARLRRGRPGAALRPSLSSAGDQALDDGHFGWLIMSDIASGRFLTRGASGKCRGGDSASTAFVGSSSCH